MMVTNFILVVGLAANLAGAHSYLRGGAFDTVRGSIGSRCPRTVNLWSRLPDGSRQILSGAKRLPCCCYHGRYSHWQLRYRSQTGS